jgi:HEAT repeat protein
MAMNRSFLSGLAAGVAVTVLLGLLLLASRKPEAPPRSASSKAPPPAGADHAACREKEEKYRALLEDARQRIEESARLSAELKNAPKDPAAPPPPDKPKSESVDRLIEDLKGLLSDKGLQGALLDPEFARIAGELKKDPAAAIKKLGEMLLQSKDAIERGTAAYLMEALGDALAVPFLEKSIREEKDDLVRRFDSHALALIRGDAAVAALLVAMKNDSDWGVRVNAAYGVAKAGNDEGLQALLASLESPEAADYKVAILSGVADVAHPSTGPLFRKYLAESKDATYLWLAITALEKMKDREALPLLDQLIKGTGADSTKNAAKKAYATISGEEYK